MAKRTAGKSPKTVQTETYRHKEAESLLRPEVGAQSQFRKKKEPKPYRYDSSLAPELNWDGQNPTREAGEALIDQIIKAENLEQAKAAAQQLKAMSKPFLNWAGKAERLSFEVPTLPLFIHERLSTKAIIETLKTHRRDKQMELDLFGDTLYSIADQVLKAYEYQDKWNNRMILGDSLAVMNSLLHYEGLGGQVQMIYIDPPYGVKFGSNFQPFVRKRDVKHNDDDNMTREPEMVKAYRDTWELGLHSYLTYMRDRLLLARELLSSSGSVFVQISDENVHHVREVMDEVFGVDNFCSIISITKAGALGTKLLPTRNDYILWYARDISRVKFRKIFVPKNLVEESEQYNLVKEKDGRIRHLEEDEIYGKPLPDGAKIFRYVILTKPGPGQKYSISFKGKLYDSGSRWWGFPPESLQKLIDLGRVDVQGKSLAGIRYLDDFGATELSNLWSDTATGSGMKKVYVVQTATKVIQRCMLMTTQPGDLVLDPTCGSGSTAYMAEHWGRRWITIDTSRVPLALAKQRLLTATFPYYKLKEEQRGPVGGFVYERRRNSKGEEVGGIFPRITLESIANNEPPKEEVLVDRPEELSKVTRVTGPFVFEATIPTPMDWESDGKADTGEQEPYGSFVQRMLEVLRKSPVLHLDGGKTIQFKNVRLPARSLSLSAEAVIANGQDKPIALVFGPENGAVSEKLVFEAAKEANAKNYNHLYVIGFAIQANARQLIDNCEQVTGIGATYVQATPDLMMGDLLKNMRSSQIFSVCGLPEIRVKKVKSKGEPDKYQVELLGLDVFDPVSMEVEHRQGDDVPAWFLDTDYNEMVFHVTQAFFPRTGAWDNLKKVLKATYEETVWDHLSGTTSAPFLPGDHGQIAVKVIDDRGNELMVIKKLSEAEG
jgi:adenine-specific DNA-methyltransferase